LTLKNYATTVNDKKKGISRAPTIEYLINDMSLEIKAEIYSRLEISDSNNKYKVAKRNLLEANKDLPSITYNNWIRASLFR
jgi:hypothetical protein